MVGAVFPSLPVSLRPNYGRGNGRSGNLLQKDLCQLARTVVVSAPDHLAGHGRPIHQRLLDTHWQVWLSLLWGHCSFYLVLVCPRFCLCSPRVSVSPALWKLCNQILLTFKVRFPRDTQSFCLSPNLGSLLWALELLQQCETFFAVIFVQFVSRLPSGSVVELMATFFKRTYVTLCLLGLLLPEPLSPWQAAADSCSHRRPSDTQARHRSGSISCEESHETLAYVKGPLVLVCTMFCLCPLSISGGYEVWFYTWS